MSQFKTGPARRRQGNSAKFILQVLLLAAALVGAATAEAAADSNDAAIVVDAKTGKTLYASQADAHRYPASLTKMMTLYLTFEALDAGKISLNTPVPVSRHAAAQQPSKLYLKPGETITVRQAILAIVTRSANDVATALGEMLGGSEDNFARLMTHKAHQLGMSRSTFRNANGLPDRGQTVTARDMATLGIALREHFPQYYHFFSTRSFVYNGHTIGNHDHLLGSVDGVDGIKTGYTYASGFNLVTSIRRDGRSVVAVVMGGRSWRSRDNEMRRLLAKYVPRASRSGPGDLVAQTRDAPTLAAVDLPQHGPRPELRNPPDNRVALAYADDSQGVDFPMPDPRPVVGRQALIKTLQEQQNSMAVPVSNERTDSIAAEAVPAKPARVDAMTTSSTPDTKPSGWVIQIGATPDHSSAMKLLDKAREGNGRLLASAEPFTEPYSDGGSQMYRARFGGFADKDKAWAACHRLKRKGYGCWATRQ